MSRYLRRFGTKEGMAKIRVARSIPPSHPGARVVI